MKLDIKALAFTGALLWGGCVFCVGVANLIWPGYGSQFLAWIASFYPGYHATRSFAEVIIGTLYALVDGLLWGVVFGGLYNRFAKSAA